MQDGSTSPTSSTMMTQAANDMGEEQPQGVPEAQPYTARAQGSALGNADDELMGEIRELHRMAHDSIRNEEQMTVTQSNGEEDMGIITQHQAVPVQNVPTLSLVAAIGER